MYNRAKRIGIDCQGRVLGSFAGIFEGANKKTGITDREPERPRLRPRTLSLTFQNETLGFFDHIRRGEVYLNTTGREL